MSIFRLSLLLIKKTFSKAKIKRSESFDHRGVYVRPKMKIHNKASETVYFNKYITLPALIPPAAIRYYLWVGARADIIGRFKNFYLDFSGPKGVNPTSY